MVETGTTHPAFGVVVGVANVGNTFPLLFFCGRAFGALSFTSATGAIVVGICDRDEVLGWIHDIETRNTETTYIYMWIVLRPSHHSPLSS